jgi:putative PIN family toxin of toxin-antitoxin system
LARERLLPVVTGRTVVFDTNVLVAELAFPDEPLACVSLAESGAVEAAASPALLREFSAVLGRDHLPLPSERRNIAVERAADLARVVEPAVSLDVADDDDDDAVLECALTVGADSVVSDDYHLRDLDGFAGIEVVTREAFLDRYLDRPASISGDDAHRNPEG